MKVRSRGRHRLPSSFFRPAVTGRIILFLATVTIAAVCHAESKYDVGASDTEIKIGQTAAYSGPASAFASVGQIMAGYFRMINEAGGINKRKINFITLDDSYSPPKTVEQTRRLVEGDEVLAIAGSIGSSTNMAVAKYLNSKKVPQILAAAGNPKLDNPATFPWTTTFYSSALVETQIYAQYILKTKPDGKIAVLYQDDDFGRNYLIGLKAALGDKASMIMATSSHELGSATIDSNVLTLKSTGADVLLIATTPKFAAQAIRKTYELGWTPMRFLITAASQLQTVFKPAGFEASKGIISSQWIMLGGDPTWDQVPAMREFYEFMAKWVPGAKPDDASATYAYSAAQLLAELLKRCGDDLTRSNLIWQATHIVDFQLPLFLPGVKVNVSPNSRIGWRQARISHFDGTKWVYSDDIVTIPESSTRPANLE